MTVHHFHNLTICNMQWMCSKSRHGLIQIFTKSTNWYTIELLQVALLIAKMRLNNKVWYKGSVHLYNKKL